MTIVDIKLTFETIHTDTTIIFLLPQLSSILYYFLRRNLRLARSRAWDLTVASRHKPVSFWSRGYIEEWEQPPVVLMGPDGQGLIGGRTEGVLSWVTWWPSQMFVRHCK